MFSIQGNFAAVGDGESFGETEHNGGKGSAGKVAFGILYFCVLLSFQFYAFLNCVHHSLLLLIL